MEIFDLLRAASPEMRSRWITQLDEMSEGPKRTAAVASFYKTFVQLDPHAATESIAKLHPRVLYVAVDAMTAAAPLSAMPEMADMLSKLPSDFFWGGSRDIPGDVINHWSMIDPVGAANFIETHAQFSNGYFSYLVSNWAELDPDAARAWLEQHPNFQSENTIEDLLSGWSQRDEASALAFGIAHASDQRFSKAINGLADNIFHRSPDEARTFLLRLPDEARNAAIKNIATMTTGVVTGLPLSWDRLPEDVVRWMLTLPNESWSGAMSTALAKWDRRDADGLLNWMNQLPADTRDLVAAEYCSSGEFENRERAVAVGLTISDTVLREKSLRELMAGWLPESPDEALVVLRKAPLSDAQKKYLVSLLRPE